MLIDFAAITHQGRVRKNNEDAYLVSAIDGEEPVLNQLRPLARACHAGLLAAVADGMGGAAAGEIASREGLAGLAVSLFGHWGRFPAAECTEAGLLLALKTAAEGASHAVLRYSDDDRSVRGMGSTLTATVLWNGFAYLAQVGDSRAYLCRRGELVQLTTDQTLVNEMVLSGTITAEQARMHPQRSMITQALGCPRPLEVAMCKTALRRGDRLLLCSDGLHGEVADDQLREILTNAEPPRRKVEQLLTQALDHGGRDNITLLVLALDDPALPEPLPGEGVRVIKPTTPLLPEPPQAEPPALPATGLLTKLGRILSGKP